MKRIQQSKRLSQATISSSNIYVTGQVALDHPDGSIEEQTKEVLERIDSLLYESGSSKKSIIFANIWLLDMKYYDAFNSIWDEWIELGFAPARACVQCALVSTFKVEISVIAEA